MNKLIAIIAGEPNSISSEIIFKSWQLRKKYSHKTFFVIGSVRLLNLQKEKQVDVQNNSLEEFQNENLSIKIKDYYFSNVIARSSKTMVECNNSKINLKSTGTEG